MSKVVTNPAYYLTSTTTISSGGTGYSAGNVLTVVGGTSITAAQITVSTVSAGVITGFTVSTPGNYSTLPGSATVSVTGGSGTGATFNARWQASAPGYTAIQHYGTNTSGTLPPVGSLKNRELFIDTAAPALYVGDAGGNAVRIIGSGVGTVTSVTLGSPMLNAFSISNGTSTPQINFTGVGSSTTQFLRGDGNWVVPPVGVSQIIAGSNVVISPVSGIGVVTISATGGGGGGGVSSVTVASPLSNALTFTNPTTSPALTIQNATSTTTEFLRADGTWAVPAGGGSGSGTVTSVGVTVPTDILSVTPASITTAGTFAITKASQAVNLVFASPTAAAGVPTFRSLVAGDISGAASSTAPLASASTAAVGTSTSYARADHVHPLTITTTGTSGPATYTSGTLNIPQYAGVTTLAGLSDVSITEPGYTNTTLIISSFTATEITTTAAVGTNVAVGDFIRGDNTAPNSPLAKVTAVSGSTITVASTVGFGFANAGSIYKAASTSIDGKVLAYNLATNAWVSSSFLNKFNLTSPTVVGGNASLLVEPFISSTATAGALTVDVATASIFTTALSGTTTLTVNNITTPLIAINQSFTFAVISTQSATTAFINAITLTGATTTTTVWQGGVSTAGGASGRDLYQFTVLQTASGVYTVLASRSNYA